jgi:hypothetical protein
VERLVVEMALACVLGVGAPSCCASDAAARDRRPRPQNVITFMSGAAQFARVAPGYYAIADRVAALPGGRPPVSCRYCRCKLGLDEQLDRLPGRGQPARREESPSSCATSRLLMRSSIRSGAAIRLTARYATGHHHQRRAGEAFPGEDHRLLTTRGTIVGVIFDVRQHLDRRRRRSPTPVARNYSQVPRADDARGAVRDQALVGGSIGHSRVDPMGGLRHQDDGGVVAESLSVRAVAVDSVGVRRGLAIVLALSSTTA